MLLMFKKIRPIMNKELVISFNWPYIIVFVLFWSYGYQGAIVARSIFIQIAFSVYLVSTATYFLFLGARKKELFTSQLRFLVKDIFLLGAMVAFWIVVAFDRLSQPIVGDHFYYGSASKMHEIYAINVLNKFVNLGNIVFRDAIYWLDLLIIIFAALLIRLSKFIKFSFMSVSILICLPLLILRYLIISHGGGGSPHPPLQLFPLWLSTSIFGLSDLSLRAPQFMGLIGCSFLIYITSLKKLGRTNSFFIATALCSIPLFIHVATLVEASIWTSVLWIILLIQIPLSQERNITYWTCIFSVISIFVLLRLTSFLAYPIFLILFIIYNRALLDKSKQALIYVASPIFLCLPFLVVSILHGTPATYTAGESAFIPNDYSTLHRIAYALSSGVVMETALSTINSSWLFLLFGVFLKFKNEQYYWFNRFLIVVFLIIATVLFFSIRPILWGTDRYKAEYLVPFIIFGAYLFFSKIQTIPKSNIFIPLLSSVMIYFGVAGFQDYPNNIADRVGDKRFKRDSEQIYDYKSALIAAKNAGLAKNTLMVGVTYGVLPEILSGYTIDEVEKSVEILEKPIRDLDWTSVSPKLVNKQPDIKLVLISDGENGEPVRSGLLLLGWSDWKQFHAERNNVVFGVIRGDKVL